MGSYSPGSRYYRAVMSKMSVMWRSAASVAVVALVAAGCGGSDDSGSDDTAPAADSTDQSAEDQSAEDDFGEALAEASGAGGGGTLIFDGEEIPVASVTCLLEEDTFDVGAVSDNDYRVFVTLGNPLNDVSAQVLDSDFLQWFPQGPSGDAAVRDGGNFSSEPGPYFNNSDDRIVEVSFNIDCP